MQNIKKKSKNKNTYIAERKLFYAYTHINLFGYLQSYTLIHTYICT